ncbi:MAG: hypothetical protein HOB72_10845 [Rhodospirillaceae bacterium]|nr:hypothetical protein [Rhodospirillaceae bacterium]
MISLHPNHGVAANPPNSFIKRLVTKIERDDNLGVDVPGLQGINWMYGHSLMEASKTKKNAQANKRVKVTVHGQITDFEFDTHNNPGTTNGKIAVTVFVTRRLLRQDGTVQDLNKQRFRWIIKVASGTYNVKRFNTASDPFPGTIAFSAAAIQKINAMGFNRKLWTIGQGIEVQKIFQWKNWPNGTEHELDPGLMKHKNLFAKTDDNCIDMLFKVDHDEWPHQFPPKNMTELNQYVAQSGLPPGYCLGRCANPFIVNTGF